MMQAAEEGLVDHQKVVETLGFPWEAGTSIINIGAAIYIVILL